jgi:hypothetical protein
VLPPRWRFRIQRSPGIVNLSLRFGHSADSVADSIVDEIVATIPSYATVTQAGLRRPLLRASSTYLGMLVVESGLGGFGAELSG